MFLALFGASIKTEQMTESANLYLKWNVTHNKYNQSKTQSRIETHILQRNFVVFFFLFYFYTAEPSTTSPVIGLYVRPRRTVI